MPRVWLITGCSSGFGRELVKVLLAEEQLVVATARKVSTLTFEESDSLLKAKLDLTSQSDIHAAFDAAIARFGRIDVLINNAGHAIAGPFETLSPKQIRAQYEANVFGTMEMTRKALQTMRQQSPPGGLIQQITSLVGRTSLPNVSVYASSKWAIEGFTEGVAQELKPDWNITLMCVEPGPFRTEGMGSSISYGDVAVEAYDHMDARAQFGSMDRKQPEDPVKGAKAIYELACMDNPPLRCVLGTIAHKGMQEQIKKDQEMYGREDVVKIVTGLGVNDRTSG